MRQWAIVILGGLALTAAFWDPLWRGAGFVAGDVYSYYFPQKSYYAACLAAGELPLWNPLAGHGYPTLGESQTGVLYPSHQVLYRLLDVHAAYHVNHLLHSALAFVAAVGLARSLRLSWTAAALAGFVYAYGWFPVRTCWEWAIIGGAWLPAGLWCAETLVRRDRPRDALLLALLLAMQMLAGHYHLAFITQLLVVAWCAGRLTFARDAEFEGNEPPPGSLRRTALLAAFAIIAAFGLTAVQWLPTAELKGHSQRAALGERHNPARGRIPPAALTQLAGWIRTAATDSEPNSEGPSWQPWASPFVNRDAELQRLSSDVPTNQGEAHLFFGILPLGLALLGFVGAARRRDRRLLLLGALGMAALVYATGVLTPWFQHLPGFGWFHGPGRFGVITTLAGAILAGRGLDVLCRTQEPGSRKSPSVAPHPASAPRVASATKSPSRRSWLALLLLSGLWLAFAILSLLAVSASVEQFVELTAGPSPLVLFGVRITDGMVVGAAVAVLAASVLAFGLLLKNAPGDVGPSPQESGSLRPGGGLLAAVVFAVTFLELWMTSRLVTYSPMVADPPLRHLAESPIRRLLHSDPFHPPASVRLFAPGGNLPTLLGVGSTPPYFTFGPEEYARPDLMIPEPPEDSSARKSLAEDRTARERTQRRIAWMQNAGVTHILSFTPLDKEEWPVDPLWSGFDPFLNPAWSRFREPLYLYRLRGTRGRAAFVNAAPGDEATVTAARANRVVLSVESKRDGRVILTDLFGDGWRVTVDDVPAEPLRLEGMFRGVDVPAGRHVVVWTYRPWSVAWGAGLSVVTAIAMIAACIRLRRRRTLTPAPREPRSPQ